MSVSKDLDPYVSPRAFYGAELRRLREEACLTQDGLGEQAFCSGAYIGQFEAAVRRPQPDLSKIFDFVLGSGEHLQRLCRLARESLHPEYFADAADLETLATSISDYTPMLIPGVLQTEAYARHLMQSTQLCTDDALIDRKVQARMTRGELVVQSGSPHFWAIVHEATLKVRVGSNEVMHDQLMHLAALIRARQIRFQVHPFSSGPHLFMNGIVSLMQFSDAPPMVYIEGAHSGQLIDDPTVVSHYSSSYDVARAASLSFGESLAMIESIAKGYAINDPET